MVAVVITLLIAGMRYVAIILSCSFAHVRFLNKESHKSD